MGGLVEAYQEVARRLGIINENEPPRPTGPVLVASSETPKGLKH
jgi:phosphoribosylaminoimidazole-succinocarboxamide synthase